MTSCFPVRLLQSTNLTLKISDSLEVARLSSYRAFLCGPADVTQMIHTRVCKATWQGWARDLPGQDRDRDLGFRDRDESPDIRDETETFPARDEAETRPCACLETFETHKLLAKCLLF